MRWNFDTYTTAQRLTPRALQRKKTLLVEYKQLKKANAFVDRRIGGALPLPRLHSLPLAAICTPAKPRNRSDPSPAPAAQSTTSS